MQSVGFAYAMEPALERLYPSGEARRQAVTRHLGFFNTHPYLASTVLGCAIRLEEEGGDGVGQAVERVKSALMGPYGALGDSFYWAGVKPLLVLVALHAAYRGALWAPWLFLGAFAVANLGGRLYGFALGYRRGVGVVDAVGRLDLLAWARRCKAASAVLVGALLAAAAGPTALGRWGLPPWAWGTGAGVLAVGGAYLMRRGIRPEWMVYLAALASGAIVACT